MKRTSRLAVLLLLLPAHAGAQNEDAEAIEERVSALSTQLAGTLSKSFAEPAKPGKPVVRWTTTATQTDVCTFRLASTRTVGKTKTHEARECRMTFDFADRGEHKDGLWASCEPRKGTTLGWIGLEYSGSRADYRECGLPLQTVKACTAFNATVVEPLAEACGDWRTARGAPISRAPEVDRQPAQTPTPQPDTRTQPVLGERPRLIVGPGTVAANGAGATEVADLSAAAPGATSAKMDTRARRDGSEQPVRILVQVMNAKHDEMDIVWVRAEVENTLRLGFPGADVAVLHCGTMKKPKCVDLPSWTATHLMLIMLDRKGQSFWSVTSMTPPVVLFNSTTAAQVGAALRAESKLMAEAVVTAIRRNVSGEAGAAVISE